MKICIVNITPVPEDYLADSRRAVEACCARVLQPGTELEFRAPTNGCVTAPQRLVTRALGTPIPSRVHAARLSGEDIARINEGYS